MGAMRRNCCGTQHGLGPAVVVAAAAAVALERRAAAAVGWARPASSDEEARDF